MRVPWHAHIKANRGVFGFNVDLLTLGAFIEIEVVNTSHLRSQNFNLSVLSS